MLAAVAAAGLVLIGLSILGLFYRLVRGPSAQDRVLAFDTIAVNAIAFAALYSLAFDTTTYIDLFLVIAIISFLGSVALAQFLLHGAVVERAGGE